MDPGFQVNLPDQNQSVPASSWGRRVTMASRILSLLVGLVIGPTPIDWIVAEVAGAALKLILPQGASVGGWARVNGGYPTAGRTQLDSSTAGANMARPSLRPRLRSFAP